MMPIYKYKSLEAAEKHLQVLLPDDPFKRLSNLERLITPIKPKKKIPKGIFKFKSLEQANQHRKETTG